LEIGFHLKVMLIELIRGFSINFSLTHHFLNNCILNSSVVIFLVQITSGEVGMIPIISVACQCLKYWIMKSGDSTISCLVMRISSLSTWIDWTTNIHGGDCVSTIIQFPFNALIGSQMEVCGSNLSQNVKRSLYVAEIVFYYGCLAVPWDLFQICLEFEYPEILSQLCHRQRQSSPTLVCLASLPSTGIWVLCITVVRHNWQTVSTFSMG